MYILVHMSKNKGTGTNSKQKILVYGATGMLGSRIRELLGDKFRIISPPHSHLDLGNKVQVIKNINDTMPDQIVYAAGITKIDYAQLHPLETFRLNASVLRYISSHAKKLNIPLHYISTDAVFDGRIYERPYKENDSTKPISVYGKSKLEGEKIVLNSSESNSVIRTVMLYSANFPHRKDFARSAYESLKNKIPFSGIIDQKINPTFVDSVVYAVSKILEDRANGIYHVAATDALTNYQFVARIASSFGFDKKLIGKTTFAEFFKDKPAPRAKISVLDTSKFIKKFGPKILLDSKGSIEKFKSQIGKLEASPIDL